MANYHPSKCISEWRLTNNCAWMAFESHKLKPIRKVLLEFQRCSFAHRKPCSVFGETQLRTLGGGKHDKMLIAGNGSTSENIWLLSILKFLHLNANKTGKWNAIFRLINFHESSGKPRSIWKEPLGPVGFKYEFWSPLGNRWYAAFGLKIKLCKWHLGLTGS